MNNIVIELCKEDRQRLDEVIAFLGLIVGEMKSRPVGITETALLQSAEVSVGLPVEGAAHLEPIIIAPPAPAPVKVSLGDFQKALVTRCAESADTKQKVQALVHKYADSVSNIPEDKRSEVLAALAEI